MTKNNKKFLRELVKTINDENTSIAYDGTSSAEYTALVDTGSYLFNAQLSGTLFGGMPNTKVLMLAGLQAVGKTFFSIGIVKNFMETHPDASVVWYMSEPAVTKKMFEERGLDSERIMLAEPITVLQWRHQTIKALDAYMQAEEKKRPPLMMVLDSLGALSTEKEMADSTGGIDKRDFTRQQQIRGTFRTIGMKLARAKVPMIVTNHTYQTVGTPYSMQEISGGGGGKYASDQMVMLAASKDKESDEVIGNIIRSRMYKNRIAKPNTEIEIRLSYTTGLDRYYGLIDFGVEQGLIETIPFGNKQKKYKLEGIEKDAATDKVIYGQPHEYFTDEFMQKLDEAARNVFEYGKVDLNKNDDEQ
jgi:RecA/RadA recombinase